jgi:hypothetical protein
MGTEFETVADNRRFEVSPTTPKRAAPLQIKDPAVILAVVAWKELPHCSRIVPEEERTLIYILSVASWLYGI